MMHLPHTKQKNQKEVAYGRIGCSGNCGVRGQGILKLNRIFLGEKRKRERYMDILRTLRSKPAHEQARLVGNIRNFVQNDAFVNLMANYDLNDKQRDIQLGSQLAMCLYAPGVLDQVKGWLRS
ncbi:MAG: hypothetical protein EBZ87_05635 [Microbacteriaceae bacterium]|nr:hypothetical protein [Microbacteriaceae bacterium]